MIDLRMLSWANIENRFETRFQIRFRSGRQQTANCSGRKPRTIIYCVFRTVFRRLRKLVVCITQRIDYPF